MSGESRFNNFHPAAFHVSLEHQHTTTIDGGAQPLQQQLQQATHRMDLILSQAVLQKKADGARLLTAPDHRNSARRCVQQAAIKQAEAAAAKGCLRL